MKIKNNQFFFLIFSKYNKVKMTAQIGMFSFKMDCAYSLNEKMNDGFTKNLINPHSSAKIPETYLNFNKNLNSINDNSLAFAKNIIDYRAF
jgi:hypothetical protein